MAASRPGASERFYKSTPHVRQARVEPVRVAQFQAVFLAPDPFVSN